MGGEVGSGANRGMRLTPSQRSNFRSVFATGRCRRRVHHDGLEEELVRHGRVLEESDDRGRCSAYLTTDGRVIDHTGPWKDTRP
jgi:hypothetical protein